LGIFGTQSWEFQKSRVAALLSGIGMGRIDRWPSYLGPT